MRISTSQIHLHGLTGIQDKYASLDELQRQLASGTRLQRPSDDPVGAARVLGIAEAIDSTRQLQRNIEVATGRLQHEDGVLSSVTDLLQRVRELAVQGGNTVLSDQDRKSIAAEIQQNLEELVSLANTRDANGDHLFAGFKSRTLPFAQDPSGQISYQGDQGQRQLQIGPARQIGDADSGHAVFMAIRNGNGTFVTSANAANAGTGVITSGSVTNAAAYQPHDFTIVFTGSNTYDVVDNTTSSTILSSQPYTEGVTIAFNGAELSIKGQPVSGDQFAVRASANQSMFATLSNVIAALKSPATPLASQAQLDTAIGRGLTELDQSLGKVLEVRASVGARLKAIDAQKSANEDYSTTLEAGRSALEDLDYAEAISKLSLQQTALQAAQKVFVQLENLGLFNYL